LYQQSGHHLFIVALLVSLPLPPAPHPAPGSCRYTGKGSRMTPTSKSPSIFPFPASRTLHRLLILVPIFTPRFIRLFKTTYARSTIATTPATTLTIMPVRTFSAVILRFGRLDGYGRVDGIFRKASVEMRTIKF
jgi:hypothetical protein